MGAGIFDRCDLAFDPSVSEAAGDKDAAYIGEDLFRIFFGDSLGIDPFDIHGGVRVDTAVLQSLNDTDVGVVELDIFSDKGYGHFLRRVAQIFHHLSPVFEVRFRQSR